MILAYGDDSADEKRERVCAVAGVVGTWRAWRLLEREWLARTNGVPFHAVDCESDQGSYRDTSHRENKALYRDLATMLADSFVCGIGAVVDLIAARRLFANPDIEDISYYRSFTRVIEAMREVAEENGEIANVTFDMRLDTEHNVSLLYGTARENQPEWTPYLAEKITFTFSRREPRIQVADLFAFECMKDLDNCVGPVKRDPRKSWLALEQTGRFKIEKYDNAWFQGLKKNYAELEKRVGFNEGDYKNWLQKRRRSHNMTNLILFYDWFDKRKGQPHDREVR